MKSRWIAGLLALSLATIPAAGQIQAQAVEKHILRMAFLIPRSQSVVIEFKKWEKRLSDATGGRLGLQVFFGGSAGDEKDVLRKMRAGQIDGTAITTASMSQFVRQVLVMDAPGLFTNYAQVDAVRHELASEFNDEAYANGFKVMGWGDFGRVRIFSKDPIRRLADFRRMRPWVWDEHPIMREFYSVIGVTGVPLGLPEVYGGLQTNMVDTVFASALAALALQWFTKTPNVSKDSVGFINAGMVIARPKWDSLPADIQTTLTNLATQYNGTVVDTLRRGDDETYQRLLQRGIHPNDIEDRPEWDKVGKKLREKFVGRLYSRETLTRAEAVVARHPDHAAHPAH
jgi:TRAP-type C4-dicarboxylate transport system substrate-binding protein